MKTTLAPKTRAMIQGVTYFVLTAVLAAAASILNTPKTSEPDTLAELSTPSLSAQPVSLTRIETETSAPLEKLSNSLSKKYNRPRYEIDKIVNNAAQASEEFDVPMSTILAVIAVESSFNPKAFNRSGATGLMQVIHKWHPEKVQDSESLFDIATNVRVGTQILDEYRVTQSWSQGLKKYSGGARQYPEKVARAKNYIDSILEG